VPEFPPAGGACAAARKRSATEASARGREAQGRWRISSAPVRRSQAATPASAEDAANTSCFGGGGAMSRGEGFRVLCHGSGAGDAGEPICYRGKETFP
jgi:hypothetical protein